MRRGTVVCLAVVLLGGACVSPTATPSPPPAAATPSPARAPTPSPTPSPTPTPTPSPRAGPAVVERVEVVAHGLEVPWAIDFAADGRVFLTERAGRIRILRPDGTLDPEPWATVPAAFALDREMGLLGLAIDPDFLRNRFVFVYYTYRANGGALRNRLVRLRDENGRGVVDRVLLDDIAGAGNHDGARLKFGPDGKLYLTVGDAERPQLAQDRRSLNGKVLRLERDGAAPADNPFPGSVVYSLGHRHPQGLAFHPDGGLYATEHGPSGDPRRGQACCNDEVNRIAPGANYGWPLVFGVAKDQRFVDPVHASGADTWAPSGATFITRTGPLRGSLLFATLRGTHLHRVLFGPDGASVIFAERLLAGQFGRLRDAVEGPEGAIYVLTSNRDGRGRPAAEDDRVLRVVLR